MKAYKYQQPHGPLYIFIEGIKLNSENEEEKDLPKFLKIVQNIKTREISFSCSKYRDNKATEWLDASADYLDSLIKLYKATLSLVNSS